MTAELAQLRTSTAWKITAPLRASGDTLRRLLSIGRRVHFAISSRGGIIATSKAIASIVRREGPGGLKNRIIRATGRGAMRPEAEIAYSSWIERFDTYAADALARTAGQIDALRVRPTFSFVVPAYNSPPGVMKEMVDSVLAQTYPNWELCIADDASTDVAAKEALLAQSKRDPRIKVVFRTENGHISAASNSALALATGDYVALLDHDDTIPSHALFVVAHYINAHPDAKMFYSDEDKITEDGQRFAPYFKPDWNVELIRGQNFFSHLGVYLRDLIESVGGFRETFEGAQDYDLMLRCVDAVPDTPPVHIPHVLYHWRVVAGSTAGGSEAKPYAFAAAMRALKEHLARRGIAGEVVESAPGSGYSKVVYAVPDPAPLVSIIIPTRDGLALLSHCVSSVLERTAYLNFEIVIVDNGSADPATLEYFGTISNLPNVRILRDDSPFNYSALNNRAVADAQGDLVCLMNNDIEAIHPEWLTEMVGIAMQEDVGAVGARLWYPDDRLQHGGVILGIGGIAGHAHHLLKPEESGYFSRAVLAQDLSAVTAACLLIRTALYKAVNGLDEQLAVAFNDVDFCIRVRQAGYRNVWTPHAQLYHHESATRGSDLSPGKRERFASEVMFMQNRWGAILQNDPAYNQNLSLFGNDHCFAIAAAPRIRLP
ncbi:MAG: glycosyltransferase family 2 protein [Burkholderiaceae bacterium]|nr:glycosyltransferase family 2 protein [Burkholderiaceae bacterium]